VTTLFVGCGNVGAALAQRLVARGERVLGLTRSERALPEHVVPIRAELPSESLVLPTEVVHLVYAVAPGARDDAAYARGYPLGLTSVLDALDRAGATLRRAVLVSSTAVYTQDDGSYVDERSPVTEAGTAARILEAERLLGARLGARGVVLRLSGIYGPGRDRIVRAIREGKPAPGDPTRVGNRIHRDDAAAATDHLLHLEATERVYVGTDDASVPMGEVFDWVASRVGVALVPPDASGRGATSKRLSNARLRATGFTFRYPTYREGYGALLVG